MSRVNGVKVGVGGGLEEKMEMEKKETLSGGGSEE